MSFFNRVAQNLCITLIVLAAAVAMARAADYHVGDAQPYSSIGAVPLHQLNPGDTVFIHWRATPYREKFVIGREGTQVAPITIRGVPSASGALPIIDGQNATTPAPLNYWNEPRSIIKIGGSNTPANDVARWIIVENLDIRGGRPPNTFTGDNGTVQSYVNNAAAVHVELGEHITIRNCIVRECGNGIFVSSSGENVSRDITLEGNYIHSNGNPGSLFEHNTYTAAIGIVYQFNRFGPPQSGASGNNLKDRSAGLVVRYNWIEGGNRQLDLVDAEDSTLIRDDPSYDRTFVHGNILIEPPGAGNKQIIHYGGDSGSLGDYRKGLLHFYNNTIVSTRTDSTTLMRLSTNDEHCDARNNILYVTTAGNSLSMLDSAGTLDLSHNWIKPGWVGSFGTLAGTIINDGTQIETSSPGFVNAAAEDFMLADGSVCLNAAGPLHPEASAAHPLDQQYVKHQGITTRTIAGVASDLGAFEQQAAVFCPGDLDCDGDLDAAVATAFAIALADEAAYETTYDCDIGSADISADGRRDGLDIAPFVALVLSVECP